MGYVFNDPEREEQQLQPAQQTTPTLGGGGASLGGGVGGPQQSQPSGGAPVKSNPAQKGTGFTNLNSWLDAGKGRDKQITSTGTGLLGQEKDAFNKAAEPLRSASFTVQSDDAKTLFDQGADDKLKGQLEQDYSGPMTVDYDPTNKQNLWDTKALTDAETAGATLNKGNPYSSGMQRLDSILFGSDGASRNATDALGKDLSGWATGAETEHKALEAKATGWKDEAKKARDATREQLLGIGKSFQGGIKDRVDKANAAELAAFNAPQFSGVERSGWTGIGGEGTAGASANAGNIATDSEIAGLLRLSNLLGDPSLALADTGTHTQGQWHSKPVNPPPPAGKGPVDNLGIAAPPATKTGAPASGYAAYNKEVTDEDKKRKALGRK